MKLRPATRDDIPLLRHWDSQPHVVAANPNDTWDWEQDLAQTAEWRQALIAEDHNRPLGFLQIMDPSRDPDGYWKPFRDPLPSCWRALDIWIGEPADTGRGHGTQMMDLALARCFADPTVTTVLVDPLADNTRAHRFYRNLGFRFIAACRFGEDHCHVYGLSRRDYNEPDKYQR